jgi:hypothetical protein
MSEYKKVKFWFNAGEEDLYQAVLDILQSQGCHLSSSTKKDRQLLNGLGLSVRFNGVIRAETEKKGSWWHDNLSNFEEINIDWMRTKKPNTELKAYDELIRIQKDIEEAIKRIKPVEE